MHDNLPSVVTTQRSSVSTSYLMPVQVDYPAALELRALAARHATLPKYLLAVEVAALLNYFPDLHQRTLFETLWNTGARINEALALVRNDYMLDVSQPWVSLATLKQREEKARRSSGAPPKNQVVSRLVPLSDPRYASQVQVLFATLKIPRERRDKLTGRMSPVKIWNISDRTARIWLEKAVDHAADDGVHFTIPVSPHTFRHSYAMHMLYAGVHPKILQELLGHKAFSSTEQYTRVFALDVAARYRVQFTMSGEEAAAMLRNTSSGKS